MAEAATLSDAAIVDAERAIAKAQRAYRLAEPGQRTRKRRELVLTVAAALQVEVQAERMRR